MTINQTLVNLEVVFIRVFFFFKKKLSVNRRLDEWVKLEQLDLDSVETVVDEKVEDKVNVFCFTVLLVTDVLFSIDFENCPSLGPFCCRIFLAIFSFFLFC